MKETERLEKELALVVPASPARVAVAAAEDGVVLQAAWEARSRGVALPVLFGDTNGIKKAAQESGVDIAGMEIVHTGNEEQSARQAVHWVRQGRADMLMKGLLQTADLLHAVLNKQDGLRGPGILSHVSIACSPGLGRRVLLTDAAMVMYPDLQTKVRLIENAVKVAHGLGIKLPKVAALAAVEKVNPGMPATLDAQQLTKMSHSGEIKGCVVEGPMALDIALSAEAAQHKSVQNEVAGQADILLFHAIEGANSCVKMFSVVDKALMGGVVMGALAPIVLTSRSDSANSKLYSMACAAAVCKGGS